MRAVKKSTRDYKAMGRERVLPWDKVEGSERGETFAITFSKTLKFPLSHILIYSIVRKRTK